jgi:hypothetical protein
VGFVIGHGASVGAPGGHGNPEPARQFGEVNPASSGSPAHMVALYALWYNFVRVHKTLRMSPEMAAAIETWLWSMEDDARHARRRLQPSAPPTSRARQNHSRRSSLSRTPI